MRIAGQAVARQADLLEEREDALAPLLPVPADAVHDERLGDDRLDRHARVERAERVLENRLRLAAEGLQLPVRESR